MRIRSERAGGVRVAWMPIAGLWTGLALGWATLNAQVPVAPQIPLVKGMRVVWAWHGDSIEGDYTASMVVTDVNPASVSIVMSATHGKEGGGKEDVGIDTRMMRSAMTDGRIYRQVWINTDPLVLAGTTTMVLSSAVMHDITTKGSAPLTVVDVVDGSQANLSRITSLMRALTSDSGATGTPYAGTMTRVEPGTVPFTVLVNDRPVTVPVIHMRGALSYQGEQYADGIRVLADPAFPMVLADTIPSGANSGHGGGGRVISITYPDPNAAKRLEDDLAAKRPVEIYDIYFDYNSAVIKPESDSILWQLGAIMHRHPDWKLRVTGHTDSIGGSGAGNRALSDHRAAAVKDALSSQYGIAAGRLDSGGAGDSQPLATNATLEGRARNRRVELTRE
jgi:outer membrane protein OmpA-like peptidoglycan-associated protein